MAWAAILIIIALPLLEVAIFIEVAQWLGVIPTILGAVLAGVAGLALWRHQGLKTLQRARDAVERGEMPMREVLEGLCLLVAGGLLLLPGFLSDVLGLALVLPPGRALVAALLARNAVVVAGRTAPGRPQAPPVIDVEYTEIDDGKPRA